MKNLSLLIVVPVLLVAFGFGQTPPPGSNTDQGSIKGCLAGSDGNYTVAEDGTTQAFKITSSTVDLKPHVGHDIEVSGQKTTAAGSSENSIAVTAVNLISEHCATATASTNPATAVPPTAAETTSPATVTTPVVADTTPVETARTPAVVDPTPAATATPAVTAPAPAQTATAPVTETASARENTRQLPNTATSLPLLALMGLGLVGLGLLSRRLRKN